MTKMRKKDQSDDADIDTDIRIWRNVFLPLRTIYRGSILDQTYYMVSQKNIFRKRQVGKFNTASQNCIPKTGKTKEVRANLEQT